MKLETLRKNNTNKIVISLAIISSLILVITLVTSRAKYIKTQSVTIVDNEVKFTPYDFKIMAMYKQIDGCSDKTNPECYAKMADDDRMPSFGYLINEALSYCSTTVNGPKDNDARIYTNSKGEHIISNLEKESKCYLYFEKEEITAATLIANRICNTLASDVTEEEARNCLVQENGYRFEGLDPNNYVKFNNEEWRIIGVFNVETNEGKKENLIKLIRNEVLDNLAWDGSEENNGLGSSNWDRPATLNTVLNNDYLNSMGEYSSKGLKDVIDKIASVKWNVGMSDNYLTTDALYQEEIEMVTANSYPVGLMNASDYGYAALNSTCKRNIQVVYYGGATNPGCADKDWLYDEESEWTLTLHSWNTCRALLIYCGISVGSDDVAHSYNIHPVIYLKSNVLLTVGDGLGDIGSFTNPYIID